MFITFNINAEERVNRPWWDFSVRKVWVGLGKTSEISLVACQNSQHEHLGSWGYNSHVRTHWKNVSFHIIFRYTIPRSHVEKYCSSKHRVSRKSGRNQKLIEAQELFDSIERDLKIDSNAIQVSLRDLSDLNQAVPDQPINEPSQLHLNLFLSPSTEKKHFET